MKRIYQDCYASYLATGDISRLSSTQLEAITGLVGYDRESLEDVATVTIEVEGKRIFDRHPELFPVPVETALQKAERRFVNSIRRVRGVA
jgi:hypothetical protein